MKIYEYDSYGEYVAIQSEANKKKIKNVFVRKATMQEIKNMRPEASSVLCHGTRNGAEQRYFQEVYGKDLEVMGSEISDTATNFPNTTQWDFMKRNPDWVGKYDIVYSNSLDHCTDPVATLKVWREQLKEGGDIFLEHTFLDMHNNSCPWDPLELSKDELIKCFEEVGLNIVAESQSGTYVSRGGIPLFQLSK